MSDSRPSIEQSKKDQLNNVLVGLGDAAGFLVPRGNTSEDIKERANVAEAIDKIKEVLRKVVLLNEKDPHKIAQIYFGSLGSAKHGAMQTMSLLAGGVTLVPMACGLAKDFVSVEQAVALVTVSVVGGFASSAVSQIADARLSASSYYKTAIEEGLRSGALDKERIMNGLGFFGKLEFKQRAKYISEHPATDTPSDKASI